MPEANQPDLTALLVRVERLEDELGKANTQLAKTKDELALAIIEIKREDRIIEGLHPRHRSQSSDSRPLPPRNKPPS
jgi:hypothetical protein